MRHSGKRCASFVLAMFCLAAAGTPGNAQDKAPIKIGLMLPYRGVYAISAEHMDRGFQAAVAEFGGNIAGHPVEIIRADDELNPMTGVQRFNKLVQSDNVDLVAGVIASNVGIALSELADRSHVPLVLVNANSDEITGKFCSPYVGRTAFSSNAYQYNSGKYWAGKGIKTATIMGPDYSAGHSNLDAFRRGFEEAGGTVLQEIWTPFQKTKDWAAALAQADAAGAQIIYAFFAGSEAIQVVKQHAEFGLRARMPLIGDQWLYDDALWPSLGDDVIGGENIAIYFAALTNEANMRFVKLFRDMFHEAPDVNSALGYDNGKAIMLTLQQLGGKMPEDRAKFLSIMRKLEFDAPRGKIRFNQFNSAQLEKVYVVKIVKGDGGKPERRYVDEFAGAPDLPGCTKQF